MARSPHQPPPHATVVRLRLVDGVGHVWLRELTGWDERAVTSTSTADAVRLLDGMVQWPPEDAAPHARGVADLSASDRDRLLAAVHRGAFGDRVASTPTCGQCSKPFDLHFSLAGLLASVEPLPSGERWSLLPGGRIETPTGLRARIPTGHDELAVAHLPPGKGAQQLLGRCLEAPGDMADAAAAMDAVLSEAAPILDVEMTATCPECGHGQPVSFDMQGFLLAALVAERPLLLAQAHRLARAYGWSWSEIMSLTRSERIRLHEWVEAEWNDTPRARP